MPGVQGGTKQSKMQIQQKDSCCTTSIWFYSTQQNKKEAIINKLKRTLGDKTLSHMLVDSQMHKCKQNLFSIDHTSVLLLTYKVLRNAQAFYFAYITAFSRPVPNSMRTQEWGWKSPHNFGPKNSTWHPHMPSLGSGRWRKHCWPDCMMTLLIQAHKM